MIWFHCVADSLALAFDMYEENNVYRALGTPHYDLNYHYSRMRNMKSWFMKTVFQSYVVQLGHDSSTHAYGERKHKSNE